MPARDETWTNVSISRVQKLSFYRKPSIFRSGEHRFAAAHVQNVVRLALLASEQIFRQDTVLWCSDHFILLPQ